MKKRFSYEQIISLLREAKADISARKLCHKHAISDATFYTWRKKFGDMEVPEVNALSRLKKRTSVSKRCLQKPCWIRKHYRWRWAESTDDRPQARAVVVMCEATGLSQRRSCRLAGLSLPTATIRRSIRRLMCIYPRHH